MLEWMHDPEVVRYLSVNFGKKTIADCERFIADSHDTSRDLHLAVVDDNDTYMGTVSLKNIKNGTAEFAIALRRSAMGKGFSQFAMQNIIEIGFKDLELRLIYWSVNPENLRAVRFYEKSGYEKIEPQALPVDGYSEEYAAQLTWYYTSL